jgi:hypothetical protein
VGKYVPECECEYYVVLYVVEDGLQYPTQLVSHQHVAGGAGQGTRLGKHQLTGRGIRFADLPFRRAS